jgi:hypothetical protein
MEMSASVGRISISSAANMFLVILLRYEKGAKSSEKDATGIRKST